MTLTFGLMTAYFWSYDAYFWSYDQKGIFASFHKSSPGPLVITPKESHQRIATKGKP